MNIIAMGGGGFSAEDGNPLLDRYILNQSEQLRPKICFLATASGDDEAYIQKFYDFFNQEECEPTHLSLLKPEVTDYEAFLLSQDIIYVGGGNTRNMLALWKEWELDKILEKAWNDDIILAGLSAGAICWFNEGLSDSTPGGMSTVKGLDFLPGSLCPHYNGDPKWKENYLDFIQEKHILTGFALDDGAAIHFVGSDIHVAIASRPEAAAYRITPGDQEATVDTLEMTELSLNQ